MKLRTIFGALLLSTFAALSGTTHAQGSGNNESFFAASERWQYSGTITAYASLEDAQAESNPIQGPLAWDPRDGSLYVIRNAPAYYTGPDGYYDYNVVMTNWYGAPSSPNNSNTGFLQLYDDNGSSWQNQSGYWHKDLKTFTVIAKGKNADSHDPDNDYARLWNAGLSGGAAESTSGIFHKYDYSLTATFGDAATYNSDLGMYVNNQNAASVSGHIKGIFQNTSVNYPAANAYFVFDLQISTGNVYVTQTWPDEFGSSWVKGGK